jgi:hypothetical protein
MDVHIEEEETTLKSGLHPIKRPLDIPSTSTEMKDQFFNQDPINLVTKSPLHIVS